MNEYIITTVIGLVISVIAYFLKRTMNQVDKQGEENQQLKNECVSKADMKESTEELKRDIRQIREDYTPKETHQRNFDECRKEIKEIRENYLTKEDFVREISKMDQKLDRVLDLLIEESRKGRNM